MAFSSMLPWRCREGFVLSSGYPVPLAFAILRCILGTRKHTGVCKGETQEDSASSAVLPSGPSARKGVWAQIPPSAPNKAIMPFTRHPYRRFPMQYSETYNAGPLSRLTLILDFTPHISHFL